MRISRHPHLVCVLPVCELIEHCPRGAVAQARWTRIWITGREQGAGGGKGSKVYVSKNKSEWLIFKYICRSLLAFESEWQRGAGQPGLPELFCVSSTMGSCLIQICCLSVTSTRWYFVPFVCASRPAWGQLMHLHINVCVRFCHQIVISSQVELSQLLPLIHGDASVPPPSTLHSWHPQGVTDRNRSLSWPLSSSVFAPIALLRFFERALPLNCYHLRAHISRSQVPWNIYSSVALHTKATGLECPQLFYFSPSHQEYTSHNFSHLGTVYGNHAFFLLFFPRLFRWSSVTFLAN